MEGQQRRRKFKHLIPFPVQIMPTINNGLRMTVGCAEFYYTSPERLLLDLEDYLRHPDETVKEYGEAKTRLEGGPQSDPPEIRVPERPECTGVFEERPHAVALCRCGAGLDAMGRRVQAPYERGGSGSGLIPRGAERLGRSPR